MTDPYDEIPYFTVPHLKTHPDRLAVTGRLMGLDTADVRTARVLELGCANGGNLVPLAAQLPGAELVGIEASRRQVDLAEAWIAEAGLTNVRVLHRDIREVEAELGEFDYVIAHGVYSWVPEDVRVALLDVVRTRMRPHGVAHISYNVLPGWHLRSAIRHMMLLHVADIEGGEARCRAARRLVRAIADGSIGEPHYTRLVAQEAAFLERNPDGYIFHDHLSPENQPFWFHEFAEHLDRAGLTFLADALLGSMMTDRFDAATQRFLAEVGTDIVRMEQYQDLLTNRSFRRSLVVQGEAPVDRNVSVGRIAGLHVAGPMRWTGRPDLRSDVPVEFTAHTDSTATAKDPLIKALWYELGHAWPSSLPLDELVRRAHAALGRTPDEAGTRTCWTQVLQLFGCDMIEVLPRPRVPLVAVSERPVACPVARAMARRGSEFVTSRLHVRFELSPVLREVVVLLDGTRSVGEIVDALVAADLPRRLPDEEAVYARGDAGRRREVVLAVVVPALSALAKGGVLVG